MNFGGCVEIKWKVTECSFCPKKAALDMECHKQLFLPHQRTCYKDSPTWIEIMPPIPAPKRTISCAIVQWGHTGGRICGNVLLLSKNTWNADAATVFRTRHLILLLADSFNSASESGFTKSAGVFCAPDLDSLNACAPPALHPLQSVSGPQPLEVRVKITFRSVCAALSREGLCTLCL